MRTGPKSLRFSRDNNLILCQGLSQPMFFGSKAGKFRNSVFTKLVHNTLDRWFSQFTESIGHILIANNKKHVN